MRIQSYIDFETFGTAGYEFDGTRWRSTSKSPPHGLRAVGAAVHAEHPNTKIASLAYTVNDAYHLWVYGCRPPTALFEIIRNGGLIGAWNSLFEYFIWHHQCHLKMGWPKLPYEQTVDIMAHSYAHSLPGGLDNCAAVLGTNQKDKEGKRLIRKFSLPRSPTKNDSRLRLTIYDDLTDGQKFLDYNVRDVQAEMEIANRIPHLSEFERKVWLCDQAINIRGVQIDTELLDKLINFYNGIEAKLNAELQDLTDEAVSTVDENKKLTEWLQSRVGSIKIGGITKDEVKHYLTLPIPPDCYRVLKIRQILGQSSVKKLFAIKRRLCGDGRLRGLFQYAGADRTGRWAGRGPQPQNLPKLKAKTAVFDIQTLDELLERYKRPITAIASCLRSLFVAKDGYDLMASDFSAIEAIGMAMMSGEQWRIDVFQTHGKIYEMSASKITGIPFEEFQLHKERTGEHHLLRSKIGKVAELASAYGGWINAWKNFGADEHFENDDQIKQAILKWRAESPMIVEFWGGQVRKHPTSWSFTREYHGLEGAAVQAILTPGKTYSYREISYYVRNDILYCRLPSGRNLTYHNPRLETVIDRYSKMEIYRISYMGWNTDPKKGPRGWIRLYTHGGKLAENDIQAACRDIMANAMVNLEDANYPLVLHVHDEPVAEVPKGFGSIEEMERILSTPPDWARDWPIKATGGWRGRRFRKED